MIRAIIFDFDGVLVESAPIKTNAFRLLFQHVLHKVEEIVEYHERNMGVSRFIKFRHIYENILSLPYTEEIGMELSERFSASVLSEIKKAPFVDGVTDFLEQNYLKYEFYVASSTPQEELADIANSRGISRYFRAIYGTPTSKTNVIRTVMHSHHLSQTELLFVGDALSDKSAADHFGIPFIFRRATYNTHIIPTDVLAISDFSQLEEAILEVSA